MFNWIVGDTKQFLESFNVVDMLNWIVWNRTVDHLTVCKQKTVLMLNWIVWNQTVLTFNYK